MNIVCIAWGSLLWKPQGLKLASGWHPGGPPMPIEFVRQSDDSPELALVLCDSARLMPTYWAYLDTQDMTKARAMLRAREKIRPGRPEWIGSVPAQDGVPDNPRVAAWLRAKGIDAAIWTAIPPKFDGENGRVPTADEVVAWLGSCTGEQRDAAEDYIRRTPAHIDTPYRRIIAARLGWRSLREAHVTQMR
jgi:hypothetical protein